MKTEELISLYREYYNNPSISNLLVEGIANYSFDDIDRILYSDELNIYPKHIPIIEYFIIISRVIIS